MKMDFSHLMKQGKGLLLADGGSTKMEWLLLRADEIAMRLVVPGVNPLVRGIKPLTDVFASISAMLPFRPYAVGYYGAGCVPSICHDIENAATHIFGCYAECGSDLQLAARLLCGNMPGVVCILGTGSCSGVFHEGKLIKQVPSLGYVLGDEGGAVSMGRKIVRDCLRGQADDAAIEQWNKTGITMQTVMDNVYGSGTAPAAFLGSVLKLMAPAFGVSHYLQYVVESSLRDFFTHHIDAYSLPPDSVLYFTGSVAEAFAEQLRTLAEERSLKINRIVKQPFQIINGYGSQE